MVNSHASKKFTLHNSSWFCRTTPPTACEWSKWSERGQIWTWRWKDLIMFLSKNIYQVTWPIQLNIFPYSQPYWFICKIKENEFTRRTRRLKLWRWRTRRRSSWASRHDNIFFLIDKILMNLRVFLIFMPLDISRIYAHGVHYWSWVEICQHS